MLRGGGAAAGNLARLGVFADLGFVGALPLDFDRLAAVLHSCKLEGQLAELADLLAQNSSKSKLSVAVVWGHCVWRISRRSPLPHY